MRRRFEDWPERMTSFLQDIRLRPFDWNGWSCALFALRHADIITGSAHYDEFSPYCRDRESSLAHLAGKSGMESVATSLFGAALATPKLAQRGDIMLVDNAGDETIGVVDFSGQHVLILSVEHGLLTVPVTSLKLLKAWRV